MGKPTRGFKIKPFILHWLRQAIMGEMERQHEIQEESWRGGSRF
jgi:hypothetical protein